MSNDIFYDVDQVDWASLGFEQAPLWLKGLVSDEQSIRRNSIRYLIDHDIYDSSPCARFIVPYILRILEHQEVNTETEILLEFLVALRSYAIEFKGLGMAVEDSEAVISSIENSMGIYRELLKHPLASDAANRLINKIEQS